MPIITEKMIINEVIQKYPASMKVFNRFKVDSCCGGAQSIKVTAELNGADLAGLMTALNEITKGEKQ